MAQSSDQTLPLEPTLVFSSRAKSRSVQTSLPFGLPTDVQKTTPPQAPSQVVELIRTRSLETRRKARRRGLLNLLCFVILPVFANTGIYYVQSNGYSEVNTVLHIHTPAVPSPTNQSLLSSLDPPTTGEAIAAEETVHSSTVMDIITQSPSIPEDWLAIPTLTGLSDLLLSNERIRLSRYRDLVKASYDPTEQVIRLTVITQDLENSREISQKLIEIIRTTVNDSVHDTRIQLLAEAEIALQTAEDVYASSLETVQHLEHQIGAVDPEIEIKLIYEMIGKLRADRLEHEVQLRTHGSQPDSNSAVSTVLRNKIAILDETIANLRMEMTASESQLTTISDARSLLEAAHLKKELARQKFQNASKQHSSAEQQARQHQRFVTVAALPNEVSVSRTWASLSIFIRSLAIGLAIFLFLKITIDVLRPKY